MGDPNELAERYVALWNAPDLDRRRELIEELWAEDGAHILQPPRRYARSRRAPASAWAQDSKPVDRRRSRPAR
jgi:hypothetical protein